MQQHHKGATVGTYADPSGEAFARMALASHYAIANVDRLGLHYTDDADHDAVRRAHRAGVAFAIACRDAGVARDAVTVSADAPMVDTSTIDRWLGEHDELMVARHDVARTRSLRRVRSELRWHRKRGPLDSRGRELNREVKAHQAAAVCTTATPVRSAPRRRGAGRPAARASASSSSSGGGGDGSSDPPPGDEPARAYRVIGASSPAAIAAATRVLDREAHRLLAEARA